MKFKLFQRLRDNDDENNSPEPGSPSPGLGEDSMDSSMNSEPQLSGGGLERTVENMFDQGYSEEEIRDELKGQYGEQEITQAINNTVANNATTNSEGPEPMTPYKSEDEPVSPMDEGYQEEPSEQNQDPGPQAQGQQGNMPQQNQGGQPPIQGPPQNQQPPQGENPPPSGRGTVDQATEELIETIVAENFQRVKKEFENVYQELDTIEEKLEDLDNRIHDLEVRDDEDQEQFVQKVEEMEEHIDSYQSRIGGLEKAFQQVLPNLVDNVRDLTSLVQEMKQEKGIETETSVDSQDVEQMNEELEDW